MKYTLSEDQSFPVLSLEGSMMIETESRALIGFVEETVIKKSNKFVIDLAKLNFINSSGLGSLITILTKSRKAGGEVVIINVNDQITNLLTITKLTSVFTVSKNLELALENLKNN